jgi:PAS domain S-box-containing protein
MTSSRSSLRLRIVIPVFLTFTATMLLLVGVLFKASHNVSIRSYAFMSRQQGEEVRRIADVAFEDLVSARLLDNRMVADAKQRLALGDISAYLAKHRLGGAVFDRSGKILLSSANGDTLEAVKSRLGEEGTFHIEAGLLHYNGFVTLFQPWGWRIVVLQPPVSWGLEAFRGEFGYLMPSAALIGLALFGGTLLIFRRNFQAPVDRILDDLSHNRPVAGTGISELDTIGRAINLSFERLESKAAELSRFKQEIDSAFDLIMMADGDGTITYANPACERMTGYSPGELVGRNAESLMRCEGGEPSPDAILEIVRGGGVWRGDFTNVRKNGESCHASAVVFPLHGSGGLDVGFIQRDITQEKKLYEKLLRSQKLEALGTLAGGIAHDFNNILAAILGYAELLLDSPEDAESVARYARTIHNAAGQGAELTRRILASTRKDRIQVAPVDLNAAVRASLSLLERSIPKHIEVVARLDESAPWTLADRSQLEQVIVNLAVNARDAMPEGGRLHISTDRSDGEELPRNGHPPPADGYVKLCVSDTGHGMDAETRRKVFDPFFTTKEAGKGTGLGLFIVHSIVANHGGVINIYSEPGQGTRFSVYLPATSEGPAAETDVEDEVGGTGTILVIDDEPDVLDLCRDMLASLGYTPLAAGNGDDGLRLFDENRDSISLVLLDLVMPKMGGEAVFRKLKEVAPDVKVVLSSGYSPDGYEGIDTLIGEGIAGFLSKPFSRKGLGRAIRKAIESATPPHP